MAWRSSESAIERSKKIVSNAKKVMFFTGAGISASSGIPTFRGSGGLWRSGEIARLGDPSTWVSDPWECWFAYEKLRHSIDSSSPTPSHRVIADLVKQGRAEVVTTNVDSLHLRTGVDALEVHGTMRHLKCMSCGVIDLLDRGQATPHPACLRCGNWRRHDVVLWGELTRYGERYDRLFEEADCLILVGLSGMVTGTGKIARKFRKKGGTVIEINPTLMTPATLYTTISIRKSADVVLPKIVE